MVLKKIIRRVNIPIFTLFFTTAVFCQKQSFPEFLEYKKVGYTFSPVFARPAQFTHILGNVEINGNWTPTLSLGWNWAPKADREISFRYGVHLNVLPIFNLSYSLPDGDLPGFDDFFLDNRNYGPLYLSIPLQVELKKQLGSRLYYSAMGGVNIAWIPEGSVEVGAGAVIDELNEEREFFELRSRTRKFPLYPNLRLSMGLYFMWSKLLLQTNVVYQKSIPNYFTGEYLFDNLEISERTEGDYSFSGDFVGLEFIFFFKKSKKRLKKAQERAVKNVYY